MKMLSPQRGTARERLHERGQVGRVFQRRGNDVQAVWQETIGVNGQLVLFAELPYLPYTVGVVGFIEKDRLLVAAFAHQVVRVTREQKAILAGHNSPFAVAVGFVFLGAYP